MIKLSNSTWNRILAQLTIDYPPSVTLVRSKMKSVLGFVPRYHKEWIETKSVKNERPWGYYKEYVCLDFYNDAQETFFMLKYLNNDNTPL